MIREIGSNFYSFELDDRVENRWWWENGFSYQYFKSGRNAIKALAKLLGESPKKVLLPVYTCETVIEPFYDEGWQFEFYPVATDLSIDCRAFENQIEVFRPSLVFLHDYFGVVHKNKKRLFEIAHRLDCVIVEDLTSCFLNLFVDNDADFYLTSFRKFFAIPDGGVLASKKNQICLTVEDYDEKLERVSIEACDLKQEYFDKSDKNIKEGFRNKFKEQQQQLGINNKLVSASPKSIEIIRRLSTEEIKGKRRRNFVCLLDILKKFSFVHPIYNSLDATDVPLFMPVIVDCSRSELQKYLAENNVYCPIIWQKSKFVSAHYTSSDYLYEHMLCIPIDQRYEEDDMQYIGEKLEGWSKK